MDPNPELCVCQASTLPTGLHFQPCKCVLKSQSDSCVACQGEEKRGREEDLQETRSGGHGQGQQQRLLGDTAFYSRSGAFAMGVFPPGAGGPKIACVALDAGWPWAQGN